MYHMHTYRGTESPPLNVMLLCRLSAGTFDRLTGSEYKVQREVTRQPIPHQLLLRAELIKATVSKAYSPRLNNATNALGQEVSPGTYTQNPGLGIRRLSPASRYCDRCCRQNCKLPKQKVEKKCATYMELNV